MFAQKPVSEYGRGYALTMLDCGGLMSHAARQTHYLFLEKMNYGIRRLFIQYQDDLPLRQKQEDLIGTSAFATATAS